MFPRRIAPDIPENVHEMVSLPPTDNVYSYLMFTLPMENAKSPGRFTWNSILACGLAVVSLLFQGILLYSIFRAVVLEDINWRESIMGPSAIHELPVLPPTSHGDGSCNLGGSLCSKSHDGNFTCAPPSVQLTGRWDELDTNGDGQWTREEVEASREALMCKYAVDPVEVFNVFVKFLLKREEHIWIHPDLRAGKYIDKAYFTYAKGDLIMCGYRDEKMCPNLLKRGVFNVPLRDGNAPRVGNTVESALDYCFGLLESGGTCERTLPSTYAVWKKSSVDQCMGDDFSTYVYTNPTTGTTKSMLTVDYVATQDYSRASGSVLFIVFKTIVIFLFFLAMWSDFKDIFAWLLWVMRFPAASAFGGEEVSKKVVSETTGDCSYEIQAVSTTHRAMIAFIVMVRLVMNFVLICVGETFLQKDTNWVNLLLNGVALIFVLEISNCLYSQLVDSDSQEHFASIEPMRVEMYQCLQKHPALRDIFGFFMIAVILIGCMFFHYSFVGEPLHQALECACLSKGGHCREAHSFDTRFWDKYWAEDVPAVYDELAMLKAGTKDTEAFGEDAISDVNVMVQSGPGGAHMHYALDSSDGDEHASKKMEQSSRSKNTHHHVRKQSHHMEKGKKALHHVRHQSHHMDKVTNEMGTSEHHHLRKHRRFEHHHP